MNFSKACQALVKSSKARRSTLFRSCVMWSAAMGALPMLPTVSVAAPFKADRTFFFRECDVLPDYDMNKEGNAAVRRGAMRLNDSNRSALNHLFDVWEKFGDEDRNRLAFVLATARRESMSSFLPIREAPGCQTDEKCRERKIGEMLQKRADKQGNTARANYAVPNKDGRRFYGRGYLQLTFEDNYRKTGTALGIDLVNDPDRALDPQIAGEVLVRAMLGGWYGSRKPLSFYIDGDAIDWINARNNVNPRSPNKPITAAYAKDLQQCLRPAP